MICTLFMAAILPTLKIDSDAAISKYFLPHQVTWILDDSRRRLAEKSVRIGWTYADAFKNVRKRLRHTNRDYLFATRDQGSAIEYVETCYKFCELYNFTRSVVSHGVEDVRVPKHDENGKDTGFTEEVKMGVIKFDNGSRILAFSSNPNAMRVYGGDVGLDEFAYHPQPEALWETAQGRITWGFDLGMWSSHNGNDTMFYIFAQEAQAGKGGWTHYRVTMENAVELGLVEKINSIAGTKWTREDFIQDCKDRARLPEVYEQAYNCNPSGATSAIVPWATIESCALDYKIERLHLEEKQVLEIFGEFTREREAQRTTQIQGFLKQQFAKLLSEAEHHKLGFDVAASGQGDLASIYVDSVRRGELHLSGLLTCRTQDWNFLKVALFTLMKHPASIQGRGDETGLGKQICWEAAKEFPGQFLGVNFGSSKVDMGTRLMNELSERRKRWPKEHRDIAADYFALRKHHTGGSPGKWLFTEGSNALNTHSHCDIAWSGGLSSEANAGQVSMGGAVG
jgi:phage FluMu gp28-like protein